MSLRKHKSANLALVLIYAFTIGSQADDSNSGKPAWSQFRGPNDGKATEDAKFETSWTQSKNIAWKVAIPGSGWSSPVVDNKEVWLTTCLEESKSLRALSYDTNSGEKLLDIEVFKPSRLLKKHARNSHATPTPVLDEKNIYVHFGSYGTAAIERSTGKILWSNENTKIDHQWGPASSPILHKNLLIFNCDGRDKRYVVALDKISGKQVWKLKRSAEIDKGPFFEKFFSTPLLVSTGNQQVLLSAGANQFSSINPDTGRELWSHEYFGYAGVAAPVASSGIAIVASGYGDVSLTAISLDESATGHELGAEIWRSVRNMPIIPTPLIIGNELYAISDSGILSCLELKTGKLNWKKRLKGEFAASPVYGGGNIYLSNNLGETFVIQPSPEKHKQISVNKLDSNIQSTPSLFDGSIYVRTSKYLYRIQGN